jgi:hypothetical protein
MLWFLTIARGIAAVGVGGEHLSSAAAALEGSNEHFDAHRGPIQVLMSTLMATSGRPICTFCVPCFSPRIGKQLENCILNHVRRLNLPSPSRGALSSEDVKRDALLEEQSQEKGMCLETSFQGVLASTPVD